MVPLGLALDLQIEPHCSCTMPEQSSKPLKGCMHQQRHRSHQARMLFKPKCCSPADGDELLELIYFLSAVNQNHRDGPQDLVEAL